MARIDINTFFTDYLPKHRDLYGYIEDNSDIAKILNNLGYDASKDYGKSTSAKQAAQSILDRSKNYSVKAGLKSIQFTLNELGLDLVANTQGNQIKFEILPKGRNDFYSKQGKTNPLTFELQQLNKFGLGSKNGMLSTGQIVSTLNERNELVFMSQMARMLKNFNSLLSSTRLGEKIPKMDMRASEAQIKEGLKTVEWMLKTSQEEAEQGAVAVNTTLKNSIEGLKEQAKKVRTSSGVVQRSGILSTDYFMGDFFKQFSLKYGRYSEGLTYNQKRNRLQFERDFNDMKNMVLTSFDEYYSKEGKGKLKGPGRNAALIEAKNMAMKRIKSDPRFNVYARSKEEFNSISNYLFEMLALDPELGALNEAVPGRIALSHVKDAFGGSFNLPSHRKREQTSAAYNTQGNFTGFSQIFRGRGETSDKRQLFNVATTNETIIRKAYAELKREVMARNPKMSATDFEKKYGRGDVGLGIGDYLLLTDKVRGAFKYKKDFSDSINFLDENNKKIYNELFEAAKADKLSNNGAQKRAIAEMLHLGKRDKFTEIDTSDPNKWIIHYQKEYDNLAQKFVDTQGELRAAGTYIHPELLNKILELSGYNEAQRRNIHGIMQESGDIKSKDLYGRTRGDIEYATNLFLQHAYAKRTAGLSGKEKHNARVGVQEDLLKILSRNIAPLGKITKGKDLQSIFGTGDSITIPDYVSKNPVQDLLGVGRLEKELRQLLIDEYGYTSNDLQDMRDYDLYIRKGDEITTNARQIRSLALGVWSGAFDTDYRDENNRTWGYREIEKFKQKLQLSAAGGSKTTKAGYAMLDDIEEDRKIQDVEYKRLKEQKIRMDKINSESYRHNAEDLAKMGIHLKNADDFLVDGRALEKIEHDGELDYDENGLVSPEIAKNLLLIDAYKQQAYNKLIEDEATKLFKNQSGSLDERIPASVFQEQLRNGTRALKLGGRLISNYHDIDVAFNTGGAWSTADGIVGDKMMLPDFTIESRDGRYSISPSGMYAQSMINTMLGALDKTKTYGQLGDDIVAVSADYGEDLERKGGLVFDNRFKAPLTRAGMFNTDALGKLNLDTIYGAGQTQKEILNATVMNRKDFLDMFSKVAPGMSDEEHLADLQARYKYLTGEEYSFGEDLAGASAKEKADKVLKGIANNITLGSDALKSSKQKGLLGLFNRYPTNMVGGIRALRYFIGNDVDQGRMKVYAPFFQLLNGDYDGDEIQAYLLKKFNPEYAEELENLSKIDALATEINTALSSKKLNNGVTDGISRGSIKEITSAYKNHPIATFLAQTGKEYTGQFGDVRQVVASYLFNNHLDESGLTANSTDDEKRRAMYSNLINTVFQMPEENTISAKKFLEVLDKNPENYGAAAYSVTSELKDMFGLITGQGSFSSKGAITKTLQTLMEKGYLNNDLKNILGGSEQTRIASTFWANALTANGMDIDFLNEFFDLGDKNKAKDLEDFKKKVMNGDIKVGFDTLVDAFVVMNDIISSTDGEFKDLSDLINKRYTSNLIQGKGKRTSHMTKSQYDLLTEDMKDKLLLQGINEKNFQAYYSKFLSETGNNKIVTADDLIALANKQGYTGRTSPSKSNSIAFPYMSKKPSYNLAAFSSAISGTKDAAFDPENPFGYTKDDFVTLGGEYLNTKYGLDIHRVTELINTGKSSYGLGKDINDLNQIYEQATAKLSTIRNKEDREELQKYINLIDHFRNDLALRAENLFYDSVKNQQAYINDVYAVGGEHARHVGYYGEALGSEQLMVGATGNGKLSYGRVDQLAYDPTHKRLTVLDYKNYAGGKLGMGSYAQMIDYIQDLKVLQELIGKNNIQSYEAFKEDPTIKALFSGHTEADEEHLLSIVNKTAGFENIETISDFYNKFRELEGFDIAQFTNTNSARDIEMLNKYPELIEAYMDYQASGNGEVRFSEKVFNALKEAEKIIGAFSVFDPVSRKSRVYEFDANAAQGRKDEFLQLVHGLQTRDTEEGKMILEDPHIQELAKELFPMMSDLPFMTQLDSAGFEVSQEKKDELLKELQGKASNISKQNVEISKQQQILGQLSTEGDEYNRQKDYIDRLIENRDKDEEAMEKYIANHKEFVALTDEANKVIEDENAKAAAMIRGDYLKEQRAKSREAKKGFIGSLSELQKYQTDRWKLEQAYAGSKGDKRALLQEELNINKENIAEVSQNMKQMFDSMSDDDKKGIEKNIDKYERTIKLAKAHMETAAAGKTVWETIGDSIKRSVYQMTVLSAGYKIVNSVVKSFKQVVTLAQQLDQAMVNIQVVTNKSRDAAENLILTYSKLGKQLGATTQEVANSVNTWLRQGYTLNEVNELVKSSMYLSKLGMIDSGEAAKDLTSIMKGFKLSVNDAMDVVSKMTTIDMKAAVSAGGIAQAMQHVSVTAQQSGLDIDKTMGYLSTMIDVSQAAPETAGNALKMMLSRYGNVKSGKFVDSESGESLNDVESVLKTLGISIKDETNQFRAFDDVLEEIGDHWINYTNVEKNAIATAMAGTRQREQFLVLLENMDKARELTEAAANSSGNAEAKYAAYLDSVEAATKRVQNAWEQLALSFNTSDFIKDVKNFVAWLIEHLPVIAQYLGSMFAGLNAYKIPIGLSKLKTSLFGNMSGPGLKNGLSAFAGRNTDAYLNKEKFIEEEKNKKIFQPLNDIELILKAIKGDVDAIKKEPNKGTGTGEGKGTGTGEGTSEGTSEATDKITDKATSGKDTSGKDTGTSTGTGGTGTPGTKVPAGELYTTVVPANKLYTTVKGKKYDIRKTKGGYYMYTDNKGIAHRVSSSDVLTDDTPSKLYTTVNGKEYDVRKTKGGYYMYTDDKGVSHRVSSNEVLTTPLTKREIRKDARKAARAAMSPEQRKAIAKQRALSGAAAGITTGITAASGLTDRDGQAASKEAKISTGIIGGAVTTALTAWLGPLGTLLGNLATTFIGKAFVRIFDREDYNRRVQSEEAEKSFNTLLSIKTNTEDLVTISKDGFMSFSEYQDALKDVENIRQQFLSNNRAADTFKELYGTDYKIALQDYLNATGDRRTEIADKLQTALYQGIAKEYEESREESTYQYNKTKSKNYIGALGAKKSIKKLRQSLSDDDLALLDSIISGTKNGKVLLAGGTTYEQRITNMKELHSMLEGAGMDDTELYISLNTSIENLTDAINALDNTAENLNKSRLESAIASSGINRLSDLQIKQLGTEGIYNRILEKFNEDGYYLDDQHRNQQIDYDTMTSDVKTLFETTLRQNNRIWGVLTGEIYTLKDVLNGLLNDNLDQQTQLLYSFAAALGVTAEELANMEETYGSFTLEDLIGDAEMLTKKLESLSKIMGSLSGKSAFTLDTIGEIISEYPELATELGDTNGLVEGLMNRLEGYNNQKIKKTFEGLLNSQEWYNEVFMKELEDTYKEAGDGFWSWFSSANNYGNIHSIQDFLTRYAKILGSGQYDKQLEEIYNNLLDKFNQEFDVQIENGIYDIWSNYETTVLENEINNLEAQRDALKDVNKQREYELKLIEARIKLEEIAEDKKRVYRQGVGFVYGTDQSALLAQQQVIDELEAEKEQSLLQKQIDELTATKEYIQQIAEDKNLAQMKKMVQGIEDTLGLEGSLTSKIETMFAQSITTENFADELRKALKETEDQGENITKTAENLQNEAKSAYAKAKTFEEAYLQGGLLKDGTGEDVTDLYTASLLGYKYDTATGSFINREGKVLTPELLAEAGHYQYGDKIYHGINVSRDMVTQQKKLAANAATTYSNYIGDHALSFTADERVEAEDNLKDVNNYLAENFAYNEEDKKELAEKIAASTIHNLSSKIDRKAVDYENWYDLSDDEQDIIKQGSYDEIISAFGNKPLVGEYNIYRQTQLDAYADAARLWLGANFTSSAAKKDIEKWYTQPKFVEISDFYKMALNDLNSMDTSTIPGKAVGSSYISRPGLYEVNEQGIEGIITPQGTFATLSQGSRVLTAEESKGLYALGSIGANFVKDPSSLYNKGVAGSVYNATDNSLNISNLSIQMNPDGSFNMDRFVQELKTQVALNKNIKKLK